MNRRGLAFVTLLGLVTAGCTGDDDGRSASTSSSAPSSAPASATPDDGITADAPVDGFALVLSLDEVDDGYWVPTAGIGRDVAQIPGAYWEFDVASGAPDISGSDSCNTFRTMPRSDAGPITFVDGRLVNVTTSSTLADCLFPYGVPYPEDGARFWIDEAGDQLVVSTDGSDTYVLFDRVTEQPNRLTPEEQEAEQAEQDAEQARQALAEQAEAEAFVVGATRQREQLRAELEVARQRWDTAGVSSYELLFSRACLECGSFPPTSPTGGPEVVTVVDGTTESPWTASILGATVDDWFEFLEAQLDVGYVVAGDFDPALGFPNDIRYVSRVYDGPDPDDPYDDFLIADVVLTPAGGSPVGSADGAASTDPAIAVELRLDGLGPHPFGERRHLVEATITGALGPPEVAPVEGAPVVSCFVWQCEQASMLTWPAAGLDVAFTDRGPGGDLLPEPVLAAWTVSDAERWWPGSIAAPIGRTDVDVRLAFANGIGLRSSAAEVGTAFPAARFGGWHEETWVPNGFYVPATDGRVVLDGDVDWDVVSELQAALNAQGASLTVDGVAGPDTLAAYVAYRDQLDLYDPDVFESLGLGQPDPASEVIRLSAGDWFWELDCGDFEILGVPSDC